MKGLQGESSDAQFSEDGASLFCLRCKTLLRSQRFSLQVRKSSFCKPLAC